MGRPNINIAVGGPVNLTFDSNYKIKYLRPNIPLKFLITEPNTKYIIRFDYNLEGETLVIPEGCILEFDGGSITGGNIEGNDTILVYTKDLELLLIGTLLTGNWIYRNGGFQADEEDITSEPGVLKFADKEYSKEQCSGLGRVILRKENFTPGIWSETLTSEGAMVDGGYFGKFIRTHISFGDSGVQADIIVNGELNPEGYALTLYKQKIDANDYVTTVKQMGWSGFFGLNLAESTVRRFFENDYLPFIRETDYDAILVILSKNEGEISENDEISFIIKSKTSGSNILTLSMINKPNTIYYIQYDYDLQDETIEIPSNCILKFTGGSFSNGTITGSNVTIVYTQPQEEVLRNIELAGTFVYKDGGNTELESINDDIYQHLNTLDSKVGVTPVLFLIEAAINNLWGAMEGISDDDMVDILIEEEKGLLSSVSVRTNDIARDSETKRSINRLEENLSSRMDSYEQLVNVDLNGNNLSITNSVDGIKPGLNKIPTGNAVAGLARFANINDWIYAVTDNTGKIALGIKEDGKVFANGVSDVNIIVAKDGTGDYDSLAAAIIDTYKRKNIVLHIMPGEYDIIQEIETIKPGYFDNYTKTGNNGIYNTGLDTGLRLGNKIKLIGYPGNHIICHYTGNNAQVHSEFSPFNNDGEGGFTMIGLNIDCSMVRYCIHDERGIDPTPYEVLYDSCQMTIDNDISLTSNWSSLCCIGGGLGVYGRVKVIDSIFDTPKENTLTSLVYYHDSYGKTSDYAWMDTDTDPESYVVCRGNYLKKKGGFSFRWHSMTGNSKTKMICCNNCVGSATIIYKADSADADTCTIEVLEWNNVIRN